MTAPFRDDLAAALERVGELEAENAELRERLAKFEKTSATNAAELDTALTTTQGLASRLQRENENLQAELGKARSERDALALSRQELRDMQARQPPKWTTGPWGAVRVGVFVVLAICVVIDRLSHC